jgi:micrococcal nuclease
MKIKNKTLFLLLAGFVFLFLASRLDFFKENFSAEKDGGEKSIQISSSSAGSAAVTIPVSATTPEPLLRKEGELALELDQKYYQVAKVVDGDTIDIIIDGQAERLRLIGINTPEVVDPRKTVECFGREASDNAKKLLVDTEVRIAADPTQDDRDKYGRLLRYVWRADGLFYNLEAIRDGFAYEYTYQFPYIYQKDFRAAQKYAQDNKLGLWADGACGEKNIPAPAEENTASSSNCLIKGNIGSTGEKIYHLPNCPYYKQTVINASQGEKWFCAEDEAVAAGWRKAKNCP